MTNKKVWLVTGAGRGMGTEIAKAALAAGHAVVATGRNLEAVKTAIGENDNLLVVKLDITNTDDIKNAINETTERFGKLDVLINNAANFNAGFFEELSPEQFNNQLATSLLGPVAVTRAVLALMRKQGSGHVITISSTAGLSGYEFCSAYSASKFGIEGFMESLALEVEPFGINTTIVNPGFFRTELLTKESTNYADIHIADYDERREQQEAFWAGANGKQPGDPAKLASALITIAAESTPPKRFLAGSDAVATGEKVAATLLEQTNAYRELSGSLAHSFKG